MNINVNIKTNENKKINNYAIEVSKKLKQLGCFAYRDHMQCPFIIDNNRICINKTGFANNEMFINTGIIQIILKDIAYFKSDNNYCLSLIVEHSKTWKDVYNKIKDIDKITYNID